MSFKFLKARFNGDPNIGLYGFATDDYCMLGISPKNTGKMEDALNVKIKTTTVSGTELIGLFAAGNRSGILLPKIVEDFEVKNIKALGINVAVVESRETALGNLVLCNDKGCLIPDKLKKFRKEIGDALDCEVEIGSVAGLDILGSAALASNKGCLCHVDAEDKEMRKIQDMLKVKTDVGTSGFGSPFIKAGIIVNSNGIVFSDLSTGPEIGRFEEVFE